MKLTASICAGWLVATATASVCVSAQQLPVTPAQRATAQQVAYQGIPLADLSSNAPDSYTVQPGDTLWRISGMYLRQPWRWPELWGMNLSSIRSPHRIYPGQVLYLEKANGYARLSTRRDDSGLETVRLSPRSRSQGLADLSLPTLQMHVLEPFLSEPLVVDADTLQRAPRIIATTDERVLLTSGDRAYVRGADDQPLIRESDTPRRWRVFRQAVPLLDPSTREILGYEAHYLGRAELEQGETLAERLPVGDQKQAAYVPATVRLSHTKEEIRSDDRLLVEPPRQFNSYVPHAPEQPVEAQVVSLYSSNAVRYGTEHQVVAISKGERDGMMPGHVLSLISKGKQIQDKTDPQRVEVQLPDEQNGVALVFRSFDRVSYALIMNARRGVEVGDLLINPN